MLCHGQTFSAGCHQIKIAGFHLLEIMIVVCIISVLSVMALPLYTDHMAHEYRVEAEIALQQLAASLEQYKILHNTYEQASLSELQIPEHVGKDHYQLIITTASPSTFEIIASASSTQIKNDPLCQSLLLNSAGKKGITGSGNPRNCW